MFEIKIKEYFNNSFQLVDNYLNYSTNIGVRNLKIGDWIMLCSIVAERNGEMEMFSIPNILEINRKEERNFLKDTGHFSVVLIRGCTQEVTPSNIVVRIQEDKEFIFYSLNTENKVCYDTLLCPDSFIWDAVKGVNNEFFFMDPTLEELPLFLLNLTKLEEIYPHIAAKVLNTITGIIFPDKEQEEEAANWFNEKKETLLRLAKKVKEESSQVKH